MQGRLEGDARFLPREHHAGDVGHFALLVGLAERLGLLLGLADSVERGAQRAGKAARWAFRLRGFGPGLGRADLLQQLRSVDDLLAQRDDLLDPRRAANAADAAHRLPPATAMPASRNEARL